MHGQIGAAFFQSSLKFFDKQAFAADFAQRAVQDLVALGGHAQQRDRMALRLQQGLDMFGLPQGKAALAGGNSEVLHGVLQSRNLLVIDRGLGR